MTTVAIKLKSVFRRFGSRLGGGGRRLAATVTISLGLLCAAVLFLFFLFAPPAAPELRLDSQQGMASLTSAWAKGEVIVLIRHMERCDRSAGPCLDAPDGITVAGKNLAVEQGAAFARLGIEGADIFTSPYTRTRQTSSHLFKVAVPELAWLAECKTVTPDVLAPLKVEGRNLILVTHSHCIEKIEKDIGLAVEEPPYGGMLFLTFADGRPQPVATGTITAERFIANIGAAR